MTVILVLLTFILFLMIDYIKNRGKIGVVKEVRSPIQRPALALVNGFNIPRNLSYHLGHTWALKESPALVRVGMDDFAAKLIGKIDAIKLPQLVSWIRQGQKLSTITRDGRSVDLLSPVEGTITSVNTAAVTDPETARKDAYNGGWLVTVNSPDQKTCFHNLLSGIMASWNVENAVNRLHPALAQDGGEACDDFLTEMGSRDWEATCREFLLN